MKITYPDYNNCLVNVSNSILKYYGVKNTHNTLAELDKYLEKEYKNVIILLYDGFGSNLIKRNLGEASFLNKNKVKDITSVFPATTTAATTSVTTGMTPTEHCWLGWNNYVKSIDKVVTMYLNVLKDTDLAAADYNVSRTEFPYVSIFEKINNVGNAKAYAVSPYEGITYNAETPDEMYDKIIELCKNDEKKFIYAYCIEPDFSMHINGIEDDKSINLMQILNDKTQELSSKLEDTLLIVTADHGHITVGGHIILSDYPQIKDMLIRETSIESRATNFFVKKDKIEDFKEEFNKLFDSDFLLLSKQEVLDKDLFGTGTPNEKFYDCLGDYIALAISDKVIADTTASESLILKSHHAGVTEDEVLVPLIVIDKK